VVWQHTYLLTPFVWRFIEYYCCSNSPMGWILEESIFHSAWGKRLFSSLNNQHLLLLPSSCLFTRFKGLFLCCWIHWAVKVTGHLHLVSRPTVGWDATATPWYAFITCTVTNYCWHIKSIAKFYWSNICKNQLKKRGLLMTGMLNMLHVSAWHMKIPVHFVNNERFVSSFSTGHHYCSHTVKF